MSFVHENGARGDFQLPEIMGGGVALLDYDGDGDLDVYLTNGAALDGRSSDGWRNRLFRQDAGGIFVDVTDASGSGDPGYGMGVAVGDADNDGDLDLYLGNLGDDRFLRNRGDGTFEDATRAAGIEVAGWSTSATFLDYDRDGWLDLFVTRYVRHGSSKRCTDSAGRPDYCNPAMFAPEFDVLLRNDGRGGFEDVSESAGLLGAIGAGLGVVAADLDDDGWVDLFVANDGDPNLLWVNRGDGTFRDEAVLRGVAYNIDGEAEAGMGVITADLDDDLDLDLFLTHLAAETNTYYRNRGDRRFEDATGAAGLGATSLPRTGFGAAALDLELDGDLDLVVLNGRVTTAPADPRSLLPPPWNGFAEANQLFLNDGAGGFGAAGEELRGFTEPLQISRGLAVGDVDEDGDLDLLCGNLRSASELWINETPRRGDWLSVRAVDPRYGRDAYGARVVVQAGARRRLRTIGPGFSYLSSSDPRAHFGLGEVAGIDWIEIRWPDGRVERFEPVALNTAITLQRGAGRTVE